MKRLVFLTLLVLASIILYINLGLRTGADTRSVSLPVSEPEHSAPSTPLAPTTPTLTAEPLHTSAYAYPTFIPGISHPDRRALFDRHIALAKNGEADSMLIIAEVTEECSTTGRFRSWDDWVAATPIAQSGQMPQDMQDEFKAIFDRLTPDCSYINAKSPGDVGDWYKRPDCRKRTRAIAPAMGPVAAE